MTVQHRLEKRSAMLAQKMVDHTNSLAKQLGAGERPPYHEALTANEAFAFWRKERNTDIGRKVLQTYRPWDIARLDAWLGQKIEAERGSNLYGGVPGAA